SLLLLFYFSRSRAHRALPSFPTRRSSDLSQHGDAMVTDSVVIDLAPQNGHVALAVGSHGDAATFAAVVRYPEVAGETLAQVTGQDRKSTRLNSSHVKISYAVFCLKKKKKP